MNPTQTETLDILQQVWRQSLLALAAATKCNYATFASALEAASHNESLSPVARAMLSELAESAGVVAPFSATKQ
ncbi:hypothetical protein M8A51_09290 [Schlegelella sp. S2-27]|jgi:hypothetical protein|uniref:Uncharacterized protein n=1 Tax=Caldimonas mangrovi TaxID=2944811 RepID=A0ABT0YPC8_9BURK|nr:hypothetical protein [Caldimonas mangrovi]MCM5679728.1 hypothetical protein [Caldimonas mangrovi]